MKIRRDFDSEVSDNIVRSWVKSPVAVRLKRSKANVTNVPVVEKKLRCSKSTIFVIKNGGI